MAAENKGKRKSFADFFGESSAKKSKIVDGTKFKLTNIKDVLSKSLVQQRAEQLVLLFMEPTKILNIEIKENCPFNFGLYDCNGITIETIIWSKHEKVRILSLLKGCDPDTHAIIIKSWCWKPHKSSYNHKCQLDIKLCLEKSIISFVPINELESSSVLPFSLAQSIERLQSGRSVKIIETTWCTVAKPPTFFYAKYNGIVICDGQHFGIIAIELDKDANPMVDFAFDVDVVFKIAHVNAKMMDVIHYDLSDDVKDHFMLENTNAVPVFYVDTKSIISEGDESNFIDYGDRELNHIKYPEQNELCHPLSNLFKNLKIE